MSIRKHTLYNLVGAVLPIVLSLVTIPIYIKLIGESRYGVLAVAWLLMGYFGLFDLGLGRATAQRIAALTTASAADRARTFWTALTMNTGLGIVGGLLVWPAAEYFFGHIFSIDHSLLPELRAAIPWMVLAVPMATLSGVLSGALQGRARFLELNIISVFSAALIQISPLLVALFYGPSLAYLLPAVILARLLTMVTLFWRCAHHLFAGHRCSFSRGQAKELLQFGGWVTVTAMVGPMMVILDRFVIGALLGARYVTYYTVPFQLASRTGVLSGALSSALFPRLADAGLVEGRQLASVGIRSIAVVLTPAMICGVFLMHPFLQFWLSAAFADHAALTGEILLLGFWINAFATVPYAQLQAAGRPGIVARCHLIEILPYLAALYLALHFYGLPGAAAMFGLRTAADCALLMYFAGGLRQGSALLATPAIFLLLSLAAVSALDAGSPVWCVCAALLVLTSLAWAWRNAPPEVHALVIRLIRGGIFFKSGPTR